jgi:hypothetical protein
MSAAPATATTMPPTTPARNRSPSTRKPSTASITGLVVTSTVELATDV